VRGAGLPGMQQDLVLVGSEVMEIPCLCNHIDFFCHVDYFIHLGLGCLVSIFFPFCFLLCLAYDCVCGFVQYINRDWAAHPALLGGFHVGLIRGLICGVLHFFYSRIYELSEFIRIQYIFLSLLSQSPRQAFGRDHDGVNHTLLDGDLAQDHIPTLAPLERNPHRERDGVDRNAMTGKGTDS
jgi:hypothetical protein